MSIDLSYIEKVEVDLDKLRKNLNKINSWKLEIQVLKEKLNSYSSPDFSTYKSSGVVTLDDILVRDETRINILESNLDFTNYKLNEYKAYLEILNENECEVINRRYLDITCKRTSYKHIGEDIHYSHTTVKRWKDSAIKKIAEHKYGSIDIT